MNEIVKLTLSEIQNNPPLINKKFLLINSLFYTDDAFNYLLSLIDNTDCVAFVTDKKQVYTHGEWYGGDTWKEDLFYFRTFQIFDDNLNQVISEISADSINDLLKISASDNIKLTVEEEYVEGKVIKSLKIGLNIDQLVDETPFTIDDPTAVYKLKYENSKISVDKYVPIRVEVKQNQNDIIEYDNKDIENISFKLDIFGTELNKNITVTTLSNENIQVLDNLVTSTVRSNNDIDYLILYSDGITEGKTNYKQEFGYAVCWSNEEITPNNFFGLERKILKESCICSFNETCDDYQYCWFACPSKCLTVFIDLDSGMRGGWKKHGKITVYSKNIEYNVYRTENHSLGNVRWAVIDK